MENWVWALSRNLVSCAGRSDMREYAWLKECYTKTMEELAFDKLDDSEHGRWRKTDTKMANALHGMLRAKEVHSSHGSLTLAINAKDMDNNRNGQLPLSGRQIVRMMLDHFKTNPAMTTK